MARSFNGTSDLIKATGAAIATGSARANLSYGCWLKGAGQQDKVIMLDAQNNTKGFVRFGSQNAVGGTKCRIVISDASSGLSLVDATGSAVILDSTWHHVLLTLTSGGTYTLYVDGVQDITGTISVGNVNATWAALGCLARNTNTQFFAGSIVDAADYTRTLTAADALSLAAGLPASHLGPAHYWPLFGVDSPEPDLGNGTHGAGTLSGTSAVNGARVGVDLFRLTV